MKPLLALLCFTGVMAAQDAPAKPQPAQRMEITLERQQGNQWKAVDPGFVFDKGDRVRFRFRANFDGYLYVMDYGTSGSYSLLFPREETGRENRIESGKEYQVPATQAWFRIDGPPGHDIVYWLASPLALPNGVELPRTKQPPKTLLPRCDDSIFRARGLCIDSSAGLRGIPETEALPENLKGVPRAKSRELVIMRKEDSSLVSSPVPLTGPVVYQFRLAHK
jgi:hypothetical protein